MPLFEEQIDKIRTYFEEHKAGRYPFENPVLGGKEEYVKSLYFRLLCALIRYTGEPDEMQVLYVRRLIAGSKGEGDFQDYMRMAMDLDIADVNEFISSFQEDDLRYYFCIDGSILLTVAASKDKNYQLFAEIMEMLGITHRELTYLTTVAKAIITQSSTLFDEAKRLSPDSTRSLSLYHYVRDFYAGAITETLDKIHICSCDKSKVDLSQYGTFRSNTVIIEHVTMSLQKDSVFDGCEHVIIRDCKLLGNEFHYSFQNVGTVTIENCEISDFSNRFAILENSNNLIVRGNHFSNCGFKGSGEIKGGILYVSGTVMKQITLENNKLLNCYIERETFRYDYGCTGIFIWYANSISVNCIVKNNNFTGCQCRNNGRATEAYVSVPCGSKTNENNICIGSVTRIFQ